MSSFTPVDPPSLFPEFALPWEMTVAEKFALVGLLQRYRPRAAIEIGTHFGGSLQVLQSYCSKVYSIDNDPAVRAQLAPLFPRVEFLTGDSRTILPTLLGRISESGENLEFVLVDGDHRAEGVRADIELLLQHRPRTTMRILLHDSFNPDCRRGMRQADWGSNPHVKSVELDFLTGCFHDRAKGGAFARSMWGGFGYAELGPEFRSGALQIQASQEALQRIVFHRSAHRFWSKAARALSRGWRKAADGAA